MRHAPGGSRSFGAAVCAALLVVTACTTDNGGGGTEGNGGNGGSSTDTIRGAWIEDPTTFDPALTQTTDDYRAARIIYDTVIRRDLDGELIPGLADEWELTAEGAVLMIGEGHTCADGTEITPTVVAESLTYLADPETNSLHTTGIFGDGEVSITGDDDTGEVSIELSEPHTDLLVGLAIPQAGIICPAGFEDMEGLAAGGVEGAFSGPYALTSANLGVSYEFELREDYGSWVEYSEQLEGTPAATLEFVVGGADAVANQLLTGEIDVAPVNTEEVARFEDDDTYELTVAATGEAYVMINHGETSPFQDEDLRRALAQIIDREALRDIAYPVGDLIATLGDENMLCANTDFDLLEHYDTDAVGDAFEGVSVNVIGTEAIGQNGAATIYVQEQLAAAGAEVDLYNTDVGSWVDQIYEEPETWDVTVYATVNNLGSISWGLGTVIGPWYVEGGRNMTYSENPEAAEAFEAAMSAESEEEMCEHYQIAQEAALQSVDFIPVSMVTQSIISREGFSVQTPGGKEDATTLRILD